jgi:integral membrane protein
MSDSNNKLKMLRLVALLEGISCICLFFIAMPLKYLFDQPELVRPIGMAHGVLFTIYCVLIPFVAKSRSWTFMNQIVLLISAIPPFGTFWADKKFMR